MTKHKEKHPEHSTQARNTKMDNTPMTDEEMKLFLEEQDEVERHRDAGTLLTPNMTKHLSETFNHDTTFAARALLDLAISLECQVRKIAAAWAGTGITAELAALVVGAAEEEAAIVDADTFAFLRGFIKCGAAIVFSSRNNLVEFNPHKIIAELGATKPDTKESWDQLWAIACYKAWSGAVVQLEQVARRYGPRKPKRGELVH